MVEKAESQFLIIALVLCDKKKNTPQIHTTTLSHTYTHTLKQGNQARTMPRQ